MPELVEKKLLMDEGTNHCHCNDPIGCYHAMWDGHMCFKSDIIWKVALGF